MQIISLIIDAVTSLSQRHATSTSHRQGRSYCRKCTTKCIISVVAYVIAESARQYQQFNSTDPSLCLFFVSTVSVRSSLARENHAKCDCGIILARKVIEVPVAAGFGRTETCAGCTRSQLLSFRNVINRLRTSMHKDI